MPPPRFSVRPSFAQSFSSHFHCRVHRVYARNRTRVSVSRIFYASRIDPARFIFRFLLPLPYLLELSGFARGFQLRFDRVTTHSDRCSAISLLKDRYLSLRRSPSRRFDSRDMREIVRIDDNPVEKRNAETRFPAERSPLGGHVRGNVDLFMIAARFYRAHRR